MSPLRLDSKNESRSEAEVPTAAASSSDGAAPSCTGGHRRSPAPFAPPFAPATAAASPAAGAAAGAATGSSAKEGAAPARARRSAAPRALGELMACRRAACCCCHPARRVSAVRSESLRGAVSPPKGARTHGTALSRPPAAAARVPALPPRTVSGRRLAVASPQSSSSPLGASRATMCGHLLQLSHSNMFLPPASCHSFCSSSGAGGACAAGARAASKR